MQPGAKERRRFDLDNLSARDALTIALIVIGILTLGVVLNSFFGHDAYIRWGGLALDTALLFGFFVHLSRGSLRQRRFWILMLCLLAVHLVAWIALLKHVGEWRLMWFLVMVFELPVFFYLRARLGLFD